MNTRQLIRLLGTTNVILAGALVAVFYWKPTRSASSGERAQPIVIANTVTQVAVKKYNATNLLSELLKRPLGWRTIESTNYILYIQNLRNIDCPEETIRDIIITDVAKLFARRRAEILAQAPPFEFWRTLPEGETEGLSPELRQALGELDNQRNQMVRDLLSVDFKSEMAKYTGRTDGRELLYAFLSPEKRERVRALMESYQSLEEQLHSRSGGLLLPADEAQLRNLENQKQAELAKLLTPEELARYELHFSPLASELRYSLHGFQPNAEEFQRVFQLRKTYNEVLESALDPTRDIDSAARERAVQQAETALNSEMRSLLGETRFAEFERGQDPDYQFMRKFSERLNLPNEMATQVYGMKQEAERQKQRLLDTPNLTFDQRQQAYQAIAREMERSLTQLLGKDTYREYRRSGAHWIDELQQTQDFEFLIPEPEAP